MKALYRKYRPLKLEDVVGQEQVTTPLTNAIKEQKISHAYLFTGPRGTGKTSVARIFAHAINNFDYALEDDYVDIIEIDGASNRGVDNIREIREKAAISPTLGKYKVYIIDEVHMLTKEAFNALLKTLEEPPRHVIFIMATTDAYKVPVTITSRAQTFTFKLAEPQVILEHLIKICKNEKIDIEQDALKIVVKRGGGSFRDSLSLLDQISTLTSQKITREMVEKSMGLPEDAIISKLLDNYRNQATGEMINLIKDLFNSSVKAEVIAEEIITKIIEEPQSQTINLLSKLPEVKAPFAEAKLVAALLAGDGNTGANAKMYAVSQKQVANTASIQKVGSAVNTVSAPKVSSATNIVSTPKVSAAANTTSAPKNDSTLNKEFENTDAINNFNWQEFTSKVSLANDAVGMQLKGASYRVRGGTLRISPARSFAKIILAKPDNLKILSEVSGLKVELGELDDAKNDVVNSKISAIMGGEVQDYGGGNPF